MMPLPERDQSGPNSSPVGDPGEVAADRREQILAAMLQEGARLRGRRRTRRAVTAALTAGAVGGMALIVVAPLLLSRVKPEATLPGPSVVPEVRQGPAMVEFLPAVGAPPTLLTGRREATYLRVAGESSVQYVDDEGLVTALAAHGISIAVVRAGGSTRVLSKDPRMPLPPGVGEENIDVR